MGRAEAAEYPSEIKTKLWPTSSFCSYKPAPIQIYKTHGPKGFQHLEFWNPDVQTLILQFIKQSLTMLPS